MGMIITCDCDDCYNMDTNFDETIYYVLDEALKEKLGFTHECNICKECVDTWNNDYPNMIIEDEDDSDYVVLNHKRGE